MKLKFNKTDKRYWTRKCLFTGRPIGSYSVSIQLANERRHIRAQDRGQGTSRRFGP